MDIYKAIYKKVSFFLSFFLLRLLARFLVLSIYLYIQIACTLFIKEVSFFFLAISRGVVANMVDCDIVVNEFEFQSRYNSHFRTNILDKSSYPPQAMG